MDYHNVTMNYDHEADALSIKLADNYHNPVSHPNKDLNIIVDVVDGMIVSLEVLGVKSILGMN